MTDIARSLQTAVRWHQSGQLGAAEHLYRQILSVNPQQVDALHLLGLVHLQSGRDEGAIELLTRTIRLNPTFADAHYNLGRAYQDSRQFDRAARCYRTAVELKPTLVEAIYNLGNTYREMRQWAAAERAYRDALRQRPGYTRAMSNLGIVLLELGRPEEAVAVLRQALAIEPDNPRFRNNLGNALRDARRLAEAQAEFLKILALEPCNAEACNNLGTVLMEAREPEAAADWFRRAIQARPHYANAHRNLGAALLDLNQLPAARASLAEAHRLQPDTAASHQALAAALLDQGELAAGIGLLEKAVAIDPEHADSWLGLALASLVQGDFERGWSRFEWRSKCKDWMARDFTQPQWDGTPLPGGTLYLYAEQGLGDAIQFVRYARLAKERSGARVVVECPATLVPLFSRCPGIDQLVGAPPLPAFDAHASLMSLPWILGTTLESIPAAVPYLDPDPARLAHWRDRLSQLSGLRVGITWQGNPRQRKDRRRSAPLSQFVELARVPGVQLISLQKGAGVEQLDKLTDPTSVYTLGDEVDADGAFLDTSAILANLDLVIATDTAIPHLAGALGVPVWVVLSHVADWRWLLDRSDSPWYPTMRLFRQPAPGDWAGVFAEVASALRDRVLCDPPTSTYAR